MTREQVDEAGLTPDEANAIKALSFDKVNNTGMPSRATWLRIVSVGLGNGGPGVMDYEDRVGAIEPWDWPSVADRASEVPEEVRAAILHKWGAGDLWLRGNNGRTFDRWAGAVVCDYMGLDVQKPADRRTAEAVIQTMIDEGVAIVEAVKDKRTNGKEKEVMLPAPPASTSS
jgi:hypothetical protein